MGADLREQFFTALQPLSIGFARARFVGLDGTRDALDPVNELS